MRTHTRGLNRRHLNYLQRHPTAYPAMLKSILLHQKIESALVQSDWAALGIHLSDYMALRERMDPNACSCDADTPFIDFTKNLNLFENLKTELIRVQGYGVDPDKWDAVQSEKRVLWFLPKLLSATGIIYGGSLTGAMGGGMFFAALTDSGSGSPETIDHLIELLAIHVPGLSGLKRIHFTIDDNGIC